MKIQDTERLKNFWIPMVLAIIIYCIGDVLLKMGNIELNSSFSSILQGEFWLSFIQNLPINLAFVSAITSKLLMGVILAKNALGLSEGIFLALTTILTFFLGIIIFEENFTPLNLVAIVLIAGGIVLVNYEENSSI